MSAYTAFTVTTRKQRQAVIDTTTQRSVCTGFVYQHCILHLHIPENLFTGVCIEPSALQLAGIIIPGFEVIQLVGDIVSPGPHEEANFRSLYVKPPHIQLPPLGTYVPDAFEHLPQTPIISKPVGEFDLRAKVASCQNRLDSGEAELYQKFIDVPEGPDWLTYHMFQDTYCWNSWNQEHMRDPKGVQERLRLDPKLKDRIIGYLRAADEYQHGYPQDSERYFPQTVINPGFGIASSTLRDFTAALAPYSQTRLYPALSLAVPPPVISNSSRSSNDSGYVGKDVPQDHTVMYNAWGNPAIVPVAVDSQMPWSELSTGNDCEAYLPFTAPEEW